MGFDEHDPELRDQVGELLRQCDERGHPVAAIHLEQAWLALGGTSDVGWLERQIAFLSETDAGADGTR